MIVFIRLVSDSHLFIVAEFVKSKNNILHAKNLTNLILLQNVKCLILLSFGICLVLLNP